MSADNGRHPMTDVMEAEAALPDDIAAPDASGEPAHHAARRPPLGAAPTRRHQRRGRRSSARPSASCSRRAIITLLLTPLPDGEVVFLTLSGGFMVYLRVAVIVGLLLALPGHPLPGCGPSWHPGCTPRGAPRGAALDPDERGLLPAGHARGLRHAALRGRLPARLPDRGRARGAAQRRGLLRLRDHHLPRLRAGHAVPHRARLPRPSWAS